VLFASEDGCTGHEALFSPIRRLSGRSASASPVHVPPVLSALFLYLKLVTNGLLFRQTYEQPWMLTYADRPLRVDTIRTRQKLDWRPRNEYGILNRLPVLIANFQNHHRYWRARNILRNEGNYQYEPVEEVLPMLRLVSGVWVWAAAGERPASKITARMKRVIEENRNVEKLIVSSFRHGRPGRAPRWGRGLSHGTGYIWLLPVCTRDRQQQKAGTRERVAQRNLDAMIKSV
jgi:hypothetical protein